MGWMEWLVSVLAIAAGYLLRLLANQRQWAQARRIARAELNDPTSTDDPEVAMSRGVVKVNRHRIRSEARTLAPRDRGRNTWSSGRTSDGNGFGHKTPAHGVRTPDEE